MPIASLHFTFASSESLTHQSLASQNIHCIAGCHDSLYNSIVDWRPFLEAFIAIPGVYKR